MRNETAKEKTDLSQRVRHVVGSHSLRERQVKLIIALVEAILALCEVSPSSVLHRKVGHLALASDNELIPREANPGQNGMIVWVAHLTACKCIELHEVLKVADRARDPVVCHILSQYQRHKPSVDGLAETHLGAKHEGREASKGSQPS
jgi:hypothetical protein